MLSILSVIDHQCKPQRQVSSIFLHINLTLAEVNMLIVCMQHLAENISSFNKRLNFVLLLRLHVTGSVSIRSDVKLNLEI